MKILSSLRAILVTMGIMLAAPSAMAINIEQIEKDLTTTGVEGWIHGSVSGTGQYVFTYRNPKDFFDYIEMSLIGTDAGTQEKLASFHRHDKVRVKGTILKNPSPQKHIAVTSIELIKKYQSSYPTDPYQYDAKLPDELTKQKSATFLIHAIAEEGHILVVEYKNTMIPIFASDNALVKDLSRNDIVTLTYKVQQRPDQPLHLEIDADAKHPVKIVESIKDINGKPAQIEGMLAMFPKSPEIIFNVFAVLQETKGGFNRQFTLVNFDDPDVFKKVREALQQAWDRHPGEYINGRNKLISKKIRVRVTGTYNQVAANQANPQILLSSPEAVEILED